MLVLTTQPTSCIPNVHREVAGQIAERHEELSQRAPNLKAPEQFEAAKEKEKEMVGAVLDNTWGYILMCLHGLSHPGGHVMISRDTGHCVI